MSIYIGNTKIAGLGKAGKSAYQAAVEGGYMGTEAQFNALVTNAGIMTAADKTKLDKIVEPNCPTVTTLVGIPSTATTVIANLADATNLSITGTMKVGQEILISAKATADFSQPLPNSGEFVSLDGASVDIVSGQRFNISVLCIGIMNPKYELSSKFEKI